MPRNLILAGGVSHDFSTMAPALAGVLALSGIESTVTEDVPQAFAEIDAGGLDLLTVVMLRWSMKEPRFEDRRAQYGLSLDAAQRESIRSFVASGGALFAVHGAVISFDDFPEWKEIVGARWVWGSSFHPPYGPVAATFGRSHAITEDLPDFDLNDEVYSGLDMADGVQPLMTLSAPGIEPPQPGLWARPFGEGRVVYSALGHDAESVRHPVHSRLLRRCALWALKADAQSIRDI